MEELMKAIEQRQDPACRDWDIEVTCILVNKVSLASRDGQ